LNAVVDHRSGKVLAEAVGAPLAPGKDPCPLAGVPVTTKINLDQRGFDTTNGLRLQRDLVASEDSPVAASLHRAVLGLAAMAKPDWPDFWWGAYAPGQCLPTPKRATIRIAPEGLPAKPGITEVLQDAAAQLRHAGRVVDEVAPPTCFPHGG
jgi:Asp-tRNA(Asn)/Glu-tRNA(Gln) amidotransferase A subunit family amidase